MMCIGSFQRVREKEDDLLNKYVLETSFGSEA